MAVHEVGHALGLDHTGDSTAVMFAWDLLTNPARMELRPDDIAGIQFLYGGWTFVLQTGTALHPTDETFDFAMRHKPFMGDDLVAIKKSNTGTNTTEVHILRWSVNV